MFTRQSNVYNVYKPCMASTCLVSLRPSSVWTWHTNSPLSSLARLVMVRAAVWPLTEYLGSSLSRVGPADKTSVPFRHTICWPGSVSMLHLNTVKWSQSQSELENNLKLTDWPWTAVMFSEPAKSEGGWEYKVMETWLQSRLAKLRPANTSFILLANSQSSWELRNNEISRLFRERDPVRLADISLPRPGRPPTASPATSPRQQSRPAPGSDRPSCSSGKIF